MVYNYRDSLDTDKDMNIGQTDMIADMALVLSDGCGFFAIFYGLSDLFK